MYHHLVTVETGHQVATVVFGAGNCFGFIEINQVAAPVWLSGYPATSQLAETFNQLDFARAVGRKGSKFGHHHGQ